MSQILAFDTETDLIAPGRQAPPLACVTWARPGQSARIVSSVDSYATVKEWLCGNIARQTIFVGQNVAYDMAVLCATYPDLVPAVFAAYAEDRVTDTMLRQKLLDIAAGVYRGRFVGKGKWISYEYSLDALAKRCAGITLIKDAWRLSYGAFVGAPLSAWPDIAKRLQAEAAERLASGLVTDAKEADGLRSMVASDPSQCVTYPLDDARATLAVYQAQEAHAAYLADQYRQARGAWALHLSSAWGMCTDPQGVEVLRRETQADLDEVQADLVAAGLVREDGTRDTKAAAARMRLVCERDGIELRRTDAHYKQGADCGGADDCPDHICLDADACESSGDPILQLYAEFSTLKKVLSNDVEALLRGTYWPVHTRYGLAETGRTTSSKPNIQNIRRRPGIREAFVPRPGMLFAEADYPQLELYTLAQCCVSWLGSSKLAETLLAGQDPHLAVGADMLGISYEEALANKKRDDVSRARQLAKVANFGFPGGLGADTFVDFARASMAREAFDALGLTVDRARQLKREWLDALPEMQGYFARVNALCEAGEGKANVETLFTRRLRGRASYCAACNNGFQALGSDCGKEAMWRVALAEYTDRTSPLWNCRTVAFIHDELIVEVPDDESAHDAAVELGRIMVEAANIYLPDVPIAHAKMEPLLMRRWSKNAVSTFNEAGRLIPWEPKAA